MSVLTIITVTVFILWLIVAIHNYAIFLYTWQLKEYRVDRIKDFFSTKQGQSFLKSYPIIPRAMFVIGLYVFLKEMIPVVYIVCILLCIDAIYTIPQFIKRNIRKPVITKKILLISTVCFFTEIIVFLTSKSWELLLLFFTFRFAFISSITIMLGYPTTLIKNFFVYKAKKKLQQYPSLLVVGITGSYGKTTTKTFLTQILSKKYNVIATPKNINTEIGVAKHILATDFSKIDIYIVEMGAYRKNDIKIIAEMTKPIVGILTAINEEHLSLFGSIENTTNTKYELLYKIPPHGLIVTNADNTYCMKYIHSVQALVKTFGIDEENKPNLLITKTEHKPKEGLHIGIDLEGNKYEYTAPNIFGNHNSTNIAACILTAQYLKLSMEEIQEQIKKLSPPEQRLSIYTYGAATIIDDTYNANPDGFKAALDVLGSFPSSQKRIIITRGMIELGEKSKEIHKYIAEEISFYADHLVVISKDSYEDFSSGILPKYKTTISLIEKVSDLRKYITDQSKEPVVILLENRIPSDIYDQIKQKT